MLKNPKLYSPENVEKTRYAQIGVTILAVAISGYMVFSTFTGVHLVRNARSMLASVRMESNDLSRKLTNLKCLEAKQPPRNNGGVDVFALQVSRWATEQGVKVESVTPQGAPIGKSITIDSENLGTWNAITVKVDGQGDYSGVIGLMNRFRRPGMPVQLESFSLQPASGGRNDMVRFGLMLTVFARQNGASS